MIRIFAFLCLASALTATMVDAEWVVDGNIVAHWSHVPDDPRVVTDGDGGAIFVWAEPNRENSGSYNIFAQRMRRSGEIAWPLNGVPIGASEHYQRGPVIVPDGCGGAIIVWQDTGPDYWTHMAAQRIDSVGTCVWASDGLLISTTSAGEPKLASLGDGRSIVIWEASHRIYAQCLGQLGELPWGQSGRAISPPEREAEKPHIVPDSNGGALVCWTDLDHQTFAQRVDSLGDLTWSAQGIAVTTNSIDEMQLQMVPDINGGALLAWQYYDKDVYAQKLTCEGALVWPAGGVRLSITAAWSLSPKLVSDGIGGAVVTWQEDLEIDLVLAQRIGEDGTLLWTPTGITVGAGGVPEIVSDGSEGVIVSWRGTGLESTCVEAQRIDAAGTKMWGVNVVRAAMGETGDFLQATATTDNAAIVSWHERRLGDADVKEFAQKIFGNGDWAKPAPGIIEVADVPGDEGGSVRLDVSRSSYDQQNVTLFPVTGYNVWRRITPSASEGQFAASEQNTTTGAILRTLSQSQGGLGRYVASGTVAKALRLPPGQWESLGFHAATQSEHYTLCVSTLRDSTSELGYDEVYVVTAHMTNPFVYFTSAPDSAYSVDNLAPHTPQGLTGHYESGPNFLSLRWRANIESDLSGYRVYRGEGTDFVPSEDNLVAATPDTVVSGLGYFPTDPWFIKVSAVDIHGNESGFAVLPPEYVTIATLISHYSASWVREVVEVSWMMVAEGSPFEFRVYRKAARDAQYAELSCEVNTEGNEGHFRDVTAEAGKTYSYRVLILDDGQPVTSFETSIATPPYEVALYQNYPNPFNPSTTIDFTLDADCPVSLGIYDISGRLVRTLVDGVRPMKSYTEEWDGRDDAGNETASGVYFIRLTAGDRTLRRKAVLVR